MHNNILLCGVGGQGIVLTSKLLASAAMAKRIPVMSAETIGMAQKGGSVFSFFANRRKSVQSDVSPWYSRPAHWF